MSAEEIFWAALDLAPGATRDQFLDQACQNNAALRAEVDSLLQAHQQAGSFLQAPLVAPLPTSSSADADQKLLGTHVGPYKLVQIIGSGGMGVVYVAEQTVPVKRRVALKLIKPEFTSRGVVARFEAERQALAIMDHPNIARVIDGGTTEHERPYFVMELVKGIPITEYCDRARLGPRQRLELMIPVCQAVQHAHQKGIIHRDIKPSNVLVTEYDGRAVPKVIDFGVAKAVDVPIGNNSIHTDFGAVVGTLEYMSPEQAGLNQLDIDTRSDVYSLGVLLYELLTGTTPISRHQFGNAAILEALRMVRELEPEKPSTRISSVEQAPSIAANRSMEPLRLSGLFRGDLDWIAMKALAKERLRRYQTAKDLAEDLQRYLNHEPVLAGPPSWWYHFKKNAQRHRTSVLVATVIALSLLATLVGTLVNSARVQHESNQRLATLELLRKERDEKTEALEQVAQERDAKTKALEAEQAARKQADEAGERAVQALQTLTDETIRRLMAAQPGLTPANREFLNQIVDQLNSFLRSDASSVASRVVHADSLNQIGLLKANLGDLAGAVAAYEQAIAIWQPLTVERTDKPEYRRGMADAHSNLAVSLAELQRFEESERAHLQAIAIHEKLAAEFPSNLSYQQNVANCRNSYGVMLKDLNRNAETIEQYAAAIKIYERMLTVDPKRIETLVGLASVRNNYGLELFIAGQRTEAIKVFEELIVTRRGLVTQLPDDPDEHYKLAMSLINLALFQIRTSENPNVLQLLDEAQTIMSRTMEQYPGVWNYRFGQTQVLSLLADQLLRQRNFDRAIPLLQRRAELLHQLSEESSEKPELRRELAKCQTILASSLNRVGRYADSIEYYQRANEIYQSFLQQEPNDADTHLQAISCIFGQANNYHKLKRWDESLEFLTQTITAIGARQADSAQAAKYQEMLAVAHQDRGWTLFHLKRYREAADEFAHVSAKASVPQQAEWQLKRIRNLVELDWPQAHTELQALDASQLTTGLHFYLAARIAASIAPRLEQATDRDASHVLAVKFLEQAWQANFFASETNRNELAAMPDFSSLQQTPAYLEWLQKMSQSPSR